MLTEFIFSVFSNVYSGQDTVHKEVVLLFITIKVKEMFITELSYCQIKCVMALLFFSRGLRVLLIPSCNLCE